MTQTWSSLSLFLCCRWETLWLPETSQPVDRSSDVGGSCTTCGCVIAPQPVMLQPAVARRQLSSEQTCPSQDYNPPPTTCGLIHPTANQTLNNPVQAQINGSLKWRQKVSSKALTVSQGFTNLSRFVMVTPPAGSKAGSVFVTSWMLNLCVTNLLKLL